MGSYNNAIAGLFCARRLSPSDLRVDPVACVWSATNNAGRGSATWGTVSSAYSAAMGWV